MAKESLCRKATDLFDAFSWFVHERRFGKKYYFSLTESELSTYDRHCLARVRLIDIYDGMRLEENPDLPNYILGIPDLSENDENYNKIREAAFADSFRIARRGYLRNLSCNDDLYDLISTYSEINRYAGMSDLESLLQDASHAEKFNFFYEHCSNEEIHSFLSKNDVPDDIMEHILMVKYSLKTEEIRVLERVSKAIYYFIFHYGDDVDNTND